jgi:hypothetical protein
MSADEVFPKDDPTTLDLDWHGRGYCNRGATKENVILGECQYCGKQHVKHIHTVERLAEHGTCPKTLEVGFRCAALLCKNYSVKKARNYDKQLAKWQEHEWSRCVIGNLFLNRDGFTFSIVPVEGGFRWWISGRVTDWGATIYRTYQEARTGLFNYLYDGDRLGRVPTQVFMGHALRSMLEKIGEIRTNWSRLFVFKARSRGDMSVRVSFGQVACAVYADEQETWRCELQLPCEQGSETYYGAQDHNCAASAKIEALEIFLREMLPFVYRLATLDPQGLLVPPVTEAERQQIRDEQARTARTLEEHEYRQRVAEEQRRIEAERLRKAEEERLRKAEEERKRRADEETRWRKDNEERLRKEDEDRKRLAAEEEKNRIAWEAAWEAGAKQREIEAVENEARRRAAWDAEQAALEDRLAAVVAAKAVTDKEAKDAWLRRKKTYQDDPELLLEMQLQERLRRIGLQGELDYIRIPACKRSQQETRRRKEWDKAHTRKPPEASRP